MSDPIWKSLPWYEFTQEQVDWLVELRDKAEAYDKAEKRCDSCGMPPEEVGDRCSFTGGRHWWVRVVPEIGDTE